MRCRMCMTSPRKTAETLCLRACLLYWVRVGSLPSLELMLQRAVGPKVELISFLLPGVLFFRRLPAAQAANSHVENKTLTLGGSHCSGLLFFSLRFTVFHRESSSCCCNCRTLRLENHIKSWENCTFTSTLVRLYSVFACYVQILAYLQ